MGRRNPGGHRGEDWTADAGFVSLSSGGSFADLPGPGQLGNCPTAMPEAKDTRSRRSRRPAPGRPVGNLVDGYDFGDTYHKAVVEAGLRVLAIDDFGHVSDYRAHPG